MARASSIQIGLVRLLLAIFALLLAFHDDFIFLEQEIMDVGLPPLLRLLGDLVTLHWIVDDGDLAGIINTQTAFFHRIIDLIEHGISVRQLILHFNMGLLQLVDARKLSLDLGISRLALLLFFLDLALRPPPFGRSLEEMSTSAFGGTDVAAGVEYGQDLRVHLNEPVLFLKEALIANSDLAMNPLLKGFAYQCVNHINDILSR